MSLVRTGLTTAVKRPLPRGMSPARKVRPSEGIQDTEEHDKPNSKKEPTEPVAAPRPRSPAAAPAARAPPAAPQVCGIPMKWISLVLLTVQTVVQIYVIKWAGKEKVAGPKFLASTVVLLTEVVKTVVSFCLLAMEEGGPLSAASRLKAQADKSYLDTLKICVPSLLYCLQNNLMFFSLKMLSMAVQQVTYQIKILTTALFSVILLGKVLTSTQWFSLVVMLGGLVLVNWPRTEVPSSSSEPGVLEQGGNMSTDFMSDIFEGGISIPHLPFDMVMGLLAVLLACLTSGFASVFIELLLKKTDASIWLRNVQMGLFGSFMALAVAWSQDGALLAEGGLLQGYTSRTVIVVLLNALGGLLCAAVLKYADNILRCFSTGISIIATCIVSAVVLQEYEPDVKFVIGTALVIGSIFLYSLGLPSWFSLQSLFPTDVPPQESPVGDRR